MSNHHNATVEGIDDIFKYMDTCMRTCIGNSNVQYRSQWLVCESDGIFINQNPPHMTIDNLKTINKNEYQNIHRQN